MLKTLLQKAKGYTQDEITSEYQIGEDGDRRLVKEKVVTKYYAPDTTALKTYMELKRGDDDIERMTDEELYDEVERLSIKILKRRKNEKAKNS